MAVTVNELRMPKRGAQTVSFNRRYRREWVIQCTALSESSKTVREAIPVQILDPYQDFTGTELDPGSLCTDISVECVSKDGLVWNGSAEYNSELPNDPQEQVEDPLAQPTVKTFDSSEIQEDMWYDTRGYALHNSTDVPYDPLPQRIRSIGIVTYQRNLREADFNSLWLDIYHNKVNDQPFDGFAKGSLLCKKIRAIKRFKSNVTYWDVMVELHYRRSEGGELLTQGNSIYEPDATSISNAALIYGWDLLMPERSYYQKITAGDNTSIAPIRLNNGEPTMWPWPIGIDGTPKAGPVGRNSIDYVRYQPYLFADFHDMEVLL